MVNNSNTYPHIVFDLLLPLGVHGDLWGDEGGHSHELQVGVSNQLPGLMLLLTIEQTDQIIMAVRLWCLVKRKAFVLVVVLVLVS